ncbi:MFS transporter [Streptomyces sp. NPDC002920]
MHRAVPGDARTPPAPATYRSVLRVPHARRLLAGTLLGRMPSGMMPLALLLGPVPAPGALAALYLVASGVGGPLTSRAADRHGPRTVLAVSATASSMAMAVLAAGVREPGPAAGLVAVAGLAHPPLDAALRARFGARGMMPSLAHQRVALALDSATQELLHITAPLLVWVLAVTASGGWTLAAAAVVGAVGTGLFVSTLPATTRLPQKCAKAHAGWWVPLQCRGLRIFYLAMGCVGIPIGALTPLAVQQAGQLHAPALSPALPAALSCASFVGGLAYGARAWPGGTTRQLTVLAAVFAAGWLPALTMPHPVWAVVAVALPGAVLAPLLAAGFTLTGLLAPPGHAIQSHALLVAALDAGCALGTAVAVATHSALVLPAAAACAALMLATTRTRLTPTSPGPGPA